MGQQQLQKDGQEEKSQESSKQPGTGIDPDMGTCHDLKHVDVEGKNSFKKKGHVHPVCYVNEKSQDLALQIPRSLAPCARK